MSSLIPIIDRSNLGMLAPGAGAEGRILGLDLDQVLLACPGAMQQPIMAHLEKIRIIWHNCSHEKKVK